MLLRFVTASLVLDLTKVSVSVVPYEIILHYYRNNLPQFHFYYFVSHMKVMIVVSNSNNTFPSVFQVLNQVVIKISPEFRILISCPFVK